MESFELKPLTKDGVPAAIERAAHYRLLNQPELAESICLDVLEADPDNQRALVIIVLAVTDQFGGGGADPGVQRARQYAERLIDSYERHYYAGIIAERRARAFLERGPSRQFAYDGLREAMDRYEEAAEVRPSGNDDAILRWNTCARTIQREKLRPLPDAKREIQLE